MRGSGETGRRPTWPATQQRMVVRGCQNARVSCSVIYIQAKLDNFIQCTQTITQNNTVRIIPAFLLLVLLLLLLLLIVLLPRREPGVSDVSPLSGISGMSV